MEILNDKEIWFIRLNINVSSHSGSREKIFWIEETSRALRPIGQHAHLVISVDTALVSSSTFMLMHIQFHNKHTFSYDKETIMQEACIVVHIYYDIKYVNLLLIIRKTKSLWKDGILTSKLFSYHTPKESGFSSLLLHDQRISL